MAGNDELSRIKAVSDDPFLLLDRIKAGLATGDPRARRRIEEEDEWAGEAEMTALSPTL
jgi:hypothetical protein